MFSDECSITFDTIASTSTGDGTDTVLAVYTGDAVDALVEVASDDDSGDAVLFTSAISLTLSANVVYYVQVGMYNEAQSCDIVLSVMSECATAVVEAAAEAAVAVAATPPQPRVQINVSK